MKIKTKFNLDDIVWIIHKVNEYKKCLDCNGKAEIHICKNDWLCKTCKGTGHSLITEGKWVVNKDCRKIGKIDIRKDYLDKTDIRYFDNSYLRRYIEKEENCFTTKEEAQNECDKRNKGK